MMLLTAEWQWWCPALFLELRPCKFLSYNKSHRMTSSKGHVDVVKTVIEAGANVNLTDEVSNVMQGNHLGLYLTRRQKALE